MQEQEITTSEYAAPENRERLEPMEPLIPSPDNPPWTTPVAIGVWACSVLLILFIPSLFVLPYIARQEIPMQDSQQVLEFLRSDPTAILLNLSAIIPAHFLTLALAWLVVTQYRRFSFRQTLGWDMGGIKWWHFVTILAGFFAVASVVGYYIPEQENDLMRILRSSRAAVYLLAFLATFTAPVVEEVIYRGVLYSAFQRTIGVPAAVLCATLLFAVVHVPQYYPSYSTIFLLTLLSLILTLIRVHTGNLLPCIILHTIFNGLQSIFLLIEPSLGDSTPVDPAAVFHHLFK